MYGGIGGLDDDCDVVRVGAKIQTLAKEEARKVAEKAVCIYPGSFCPPTHGHLEIVKRARKVFEKVYVICSVNPEKGKPWFTPDECKSLWQAYDLPQNVEVLTLAEFVALGVEPKRIIMIRGLRGECDAEDEKRVMMLNWQKYGISQFHFIITDEKFVHVSSSVAREAAEKCDVARLAELAAPAVVTKLLEKTLNLKSLWLVVGQPGAGKSTCLRHLQKCRDDVVYINTDEFNHALKPLLKKEFGERDLAEVAIDEPKELKRILADKWLALLSHALRGVKPRMNVFVEIGYGMRSEFRMWRFVGGRVLYVGMEDYAKLEKRVKTRGTPEHVELIYTIPHVLKTTVICQDEKMVLKVIDTDCSLKETENRVEEFARQIG